MRLEIFPTFQLHVVLEEFNAVDLVHGYYQIRFRAHKAMLPLLHIYCEPGHLAGGDNRPCVVNGAAISKMFKVGFGEQSSDLGDVFKCALNLHKRVDRLESINVELQVELWYLDPECLPKIEDFRFVSKRVISVILKPDRSVHCYRPVFFEYFAFSAVSVTVHAAMIAAVVSRKKAGPDPPLSDKLRAYHREVCFRMLSTCLSLQNFIKRHAAVLDSPLNIDVLNVGREEADFKAELEDSNQPWLKLQEHVEGLNNRLTMLFTQLLQLFVDVKAVRDALLDEFDQQRIKRLAEAFLFTEDTVQSLLKPTPNPNLRYFEIIKKNNYLSKLKTLPVHIEHVDADPTNITMIIEQRFLPAGVSSFNASSCVLPSMLITTDDDTNDTSPRSPTCTVHPKRRSSSSNFSFCLPSCATEVGDEPYGDVGGNGRTTSKTGDMLMVNNDRLTKRRMTDPGTIMPSQIQFSLETKPLLAASEANSRHSSISTVSQSTKAASTSDLSSPRLADDEDSGSTGTDADDEGDGDGVGGEELGTPCGGSYTASSSSESLSEQARAISLNSRSNSFSANADRLMEQLDKDFIAFVHQKELCKQKLFQSGFRGCFYSDMAHVHNHIPYFSSIAKEAIERRRIVDTHLIVFVHGLEGTSEDLSAYRNFLRVALPDAHLAFLMSEVNQTETWADLTAMAENLLEEVIQHCSRMARPPARISFLAHSLGGLIVRTLVGLPGARPFLSALHTLLTLNSPHCGLMYNSNWAAHWGITILQWWKQSTCLEQLTMRDAPNFRDTFVYKLSTNGAFGLFRNVLLVGSYHDIYVPGHSALVDLCKAASSAGSSQGAAFAELVTNINESIVASPRHTTLIKFTVAHNLPRSQQVTGRAVHIAAVDDDNFIEKLLTVSAVKYFR